MQSRVSVLICEATSLIAFLSSRGVEGVFAPKEVEGSLAILSTIPQQADV